MMRSARHTPLEDAAWLMEYVADTGGADHLKIGSRHLSVVQYLALVRSKADEKLLLPVFK